MTGAPLTPAERRLPMLFEMDRAKFADDPMVEVWKMKDWEADWRPIETAPIDSTWIIVGIHKTVEWPFGQACPAFWWEKENKWGKSFSRYGGYGGDIIPVGFEPTAWMPIPDPPPTFLPGQFRRASDIEFAPQLDQEMLRDD